jgi:hypothetical protein
MLKGVALLVALVAVVYASSHSEAPGTTRVPAADLTDLYVFRSYETNRQDFTVLMMNANPLQAPFGGPNYHALSSDHYYYFHIDNDGDAVEDISFEFMFHQQLGGTNQTRETVGSTECDAVNFLNLTTQNTGVELPIHTTGRNVRIPLKYAGSVTSGNVGNLNFRQFYQVARINGQITPTPTRSYFTVEGSSEDTFEQPMDNVGPKTFPAYADYADDYIYDVDIPGCGTAGRLFVGQRKETFSVNLGAIFDLINMVPVEGVAGAVADDDLNNALNGYNIDTFAIEIPTSCLGGDVIGVWSTTRSIFHNLLGGHDVGVTYSRLGQPLINEVIIGIQDKGVFNAGNPEDDGAALGGAFVEYVQFPTLPDLIDLLFKDALNGGNRIAPTNFPRADLVQTFLIGVDGINVNGAVCEYLRFNTTWPVTEAAQQNNLGVIGGDAAGFPNGRRPGDDVVDIALDVVMGALCHLGLNCTAADAPVGNLRFLDGAPQNVNQFDLTFPFARTPLPGFVSNVVVPTVATTTAEESPATSVESFWFVQ